MNQIKIHHVLSFGNASKENNFYLDKKYSIIIPTHSKRANDLDENIIAPLFTRNSQYLVKVFIYWNDFDLNLLVPPSLYYLEEKYDYRVEIVQLKERTLNNRFVIPDNLYTDTILSHNDDLTIYIKQLDSSFIDYLNANYTNRISGKYTTSCSSDKYDIYSERNSNMVITNMAFLNVNMLKLYNLDKYKEARDYVSQMKNCEDILMNYIVSKETNQNAAYLFFKYKTKLDEFGLSSAPDHLSKRTKCCKKFNEIFGRDTLKTVKFS